MSYRLPWRHSQSIDGLVELSSTSRSVSGLILVVVVFIITLECKKRFIFLQRDDVL
jgi:hypothetical protein